MRAYRSYFSRSIQETYPEDAGAILRALEDQYTQISPDTAFALKSPNPVDRRLDFSSYFLALIKVLDQRGETFDNIRKICLEIVIAYVQPKSKVQSFFKRLVPKLTTTWLGKIMVRAFHKKVSINPNQAGFVANIITDKEETFGLGYGIDIVECGICKLFQKHNYQKYAPILCEVDEVTSALAGLKLIRTGTIANGAKKCDFRFKRLD